MDEFASEVGEIPSSVHVGERDLREDCGPRCQGKIVSFNPRKGFGFLREVGNQGDETGSDIFVHKQSLVVEGDASKEFVLSEGDIVSYVLSKEEDGKRLRYSHKNTLFSLQSNAISHVQAVVRLETQTTESRAPQVDDIIDKKKGRQNTCQALLFI